MQKIQQRIESIYGIEVQESAEDYLIDKNELISLLPANQSTFLPKELFLVNPNPEADTLEIALFFDESIRSNLANHNPFQTINNQNISDFCTLIEGVSHFVYYLHKASLEHDVTQLELELQAEIDKFVLLSFCLEVDHVDRIKFLNLLFEGYFLHDNLDENQVERYHTASQLARKYCYEILQDLKRSTNWQEVIHEIRTFYTLRQEQKIKYILS